MPFSLKNAAQTFQRFMDTLLHDLAFAYCYIDDILIASRSKEEHEEHVRIVLKRLNDAGLTLNISKCVSQPEVNFWGHQVTKEGIRPLEERIRAILDYPKPMDVQQF